MKFLSSLLVTILVVSLVPLTVFAGPSENDPDGTFENPFLISSCEDLQAIASYEDYVYSLTGNIDCSDSATWNAGAGFVPIESFQGVILGNGHTVSNLYINLPEANRAGFINELSGMVADINFDGLEIVGSSEVGLIARSSMQSIIIDVKVTNSQIAGQNHVGGLIGLFNFGDLYNSSFSGNVVSVNNGGGLVGYISSGGRVHDNFFNGIVNAPYAGGLIGYIDFGSDEVYNNYTTGTVIGDSFAAGMVGHITSSNILFSNNFSNVTLAGAGLKAGLAGSVDLGFGSVNVDDYFFDQNNAGDVDCVAVLVSGSFDSAGCVTWDSSVDADYLFATELDSPVTTWDFEEVWQTSEGFPIHRSTTEYSPPTVPLNLDGEVTSLVNLFFTFDAPADLGNLPLVEYNVQIQYDGENWEYPIYDGYIWNTDPREINYNLPFKSTDYQIRINAENALGASDWVEFDFSSGDFATVDINSCEQLRDIDLNPSGSDTTYTLTQDLDCAGVDFQSIGDNEWSVFTGVLDGNNYTISNLTINDSEGYAGLFKETSDAVIRDLNFENLSVTGVSATGGIVGQSDEVYIQNVSVTGDVSSSAEAAGVIGIIEDNNNLFLREVTFNGNVIGAQSVGGIIGLIGFRDEGNMHLEKLASKGTVVASGDNAGGLIGDIDLYTDDDDSVIRILKSYSTASVEGESNVGGFIGNAYLEAYDDAELYIEDSFAAGNVEGAGNVGGFIGYLEPDYDDDNTIISLDRVYASGNVEGGTNVGGLVGYLSAPDDSEEEVYVLNSFATGLVTSADVGGGLVGFTDEFDIEDEDEVYVSNNFYAASTGYTVCDSEEILEDCDLVAEVSDFYSPTNEPFETGNWNAVDVWLFESGVLPVLAWHEFTVEPEPETPMPEAPRSGGGSGSRASKASEDSSDNGGGNSYAEEVKEVIEEKIVTADADQFANKCEVLTMMQRVFEWEVPEVVSSKYTDVPAWCVSVAAYGTERGIVEGRTATTLGLKTPVTRNEVAVMIYRELQKIEYDFRGVLFVPFTDNTTPWALFAVETLAKEGIVKGFSPEQFGGGKFILKQDLGIILLRIKKNPNYLKVEVDSSSRI